MAVNWGEKEREKPLRRTPSNKDLNFSIDRALTLIFSQFFFSFLFFFFVLIFFFFSHSTWRSSLPLHEKKKKKTDVAYFVKILKRSHYKDGKYCFPIENDKATHNPTPKVVVGSHEMSSNSSSYAVITRCLQKFIAHYTPLIQLSGHALSGPIYTEKDDFRGIRRTKPGSGVLWFMRVSSTTFCYH